MKDTGEQTPDTPGDDVASVDAQIMARICWAYFKEGQTQGAIAQRMGLTRKRVNRVLYYARMSGFVQTTINSPVGAYVELEVRLASAFDLRSAIVVPSPSDDSDVRAIVGAAAGQYISEQLQEGQSLGITWGGTIHAAAQNVLRRQGKGNKVVLMCGGLAKSTRINPYDNAAIFARMLDATCYYLTAPLYAETAELRNALMGSEPIRSVLGMVRQADMALLSATDLSEQSKMLEYDVISREMWQSLRDAGATGDICGHYFDAGGKLIDHPLTQRTISTPVADLLQIPQRVLAAGGLQKVPVIRSAIRAGLVHTLITDEATATALL